MNISLSTKQGMPDISARIPQFLNISWEGLVQASGPFPSLIHTDYIITHLCLSSKENNQRKLPLLSHSDQLTYPGEQSLRWII